MIRLASATDLDAVVDTLVESHHDYIWETWALPSSDRRTRLAQLFTTDLRVVGLPHGQVWTTPQSTSVAVWLPSGTHQRTSPADRMVLDAAARSAFGERLTVIDEVNAAIHASSPSPVDWRLATMGTRSTHRRRGLGTAVLTPMLTELDRDAATARLETSDPDNLAFYATFGFNITTELNNLPHRAPTTWIMDRSPRPR